MDGLLIKFLDTTHGANEPSLWQLFDPIRPQLDALFWCVPCDPWMGAPAGFYDSGCVIDTSGTSSELWRPGTLGKYAKHIREEYLEFWALPCECEDKPSLVAQFDRTPERDRDTFVTLHAAIWLIYTDSTCWEFFARSSKLVRTLSDLLAGTHDVTVYRSRSDGRKDAFGKAGLRFWE